MFLDAVEVAKQQGGSVVYGGKVIILIYTYKIKLKSSGVEEFYCCFCPLPEK